MFPYLVWTPPYNRRSGGCKVLHALAHYLNVHGAPVYITTDVQNPEWPINCITNNKSISTLSSCGAIAVYPEIIFGNPYDCKTVVRWVLNTPGKLGGPTAYPPEDLVYIFSRSYDVFGGLPDELVLHYPQVELNLFYDTNSTRAGICFYIGKGYDTQRIPETSNAVEITREWPEEQKDLASLFRTSELFISYDTVTSLHDNSRLCGCPTILIPGYCQKEEIHPDLGWDGMGVTMEELPRAKETMNSYKLRQDYIKLQETFHQRLDLFIETTQRTAMERNK